MFGFTNHGNGSQTSVLPPSYDTIAQREDTPRSNAIKDSVDPKESIDPFESEQPTQNYPTSLRSRSYTNPPEYPASIIAMPVQPQPTGAMFIQPQPTGATFIQPQPIQPQVTGSSVRTTLASLGPDFVPNQQMHEQYPGLTNPFPASCGPEGHLTHTQYGRRGILAAIFWFPFGLRVLHHDRKIVCTRCNEVLYDARKEVKRRGGCCGGNWEERRQRRELKREYRREFHAVKRAAWQDLKEEKRQMRAYRRSIRHSY